VKFRWIVIDTAGRIVGALSGNVQVQQQVDASQKPIVVKLRSGRKIEGYIYGKDEKYLYIVTRDKKTLIAVPIKEITIRA